MKLKEYTPQNAVIERKQPRTPAVSFNLKTNMITINGDACDIIGVKEGDKVSIGHDEEYPSDWYIRKNDEGFPLGTKEGYRGLLFRNAFLTREIHKGGEYRKDGFKMLLAGKATILDDKTIVWGLLRVPEK